MTRMHRRLSLALAFSMLVHTVPFVADFLPPLPEPKRQPPLEAHLKPPAPAAEQVPLMLPEPPKPANTEAPRRPPKPEKIAPAKSPSARTEWTAEVRKQLKDLDRQGKFYPEEARARGLEGEALVLLVLDEAGNAVAARVEESSGHRILDDAALRAVKTLKSLPADAPRETLLPVRFRLR